MTRHDVFTALFVVFMAWLSVSMPHRSRGTKQEIMQEANKLRICLFTAVCMLYAALYLMHTGTTQ